jgi:hypothetical protein
VAALVAADGLHARPRDAVSARFVLESLFRKMSNEEFCYRTALIGIFVPPRLLAGTSPSFRWASCASQTCSSKAEVRQIYRPIYCLPLSLLVWSVLMIFFYFSVADQCLMTP